MALLANELANLSCPEDKKQVKHYDSKGLYLLVKSNDSKLWRFRFKYADKHQEMALGKYPTIPLNVTPYYQNRRFKKAASFPPVLNYQGNRSINPNLVRL